MACEVRTKPTDSKTEFARNVVPGRMTSFATPLAKNQALPFMCAAVE